MSYTSTPGRFLRHCRRHTEREFVPWPYIAAGLMFATAAIAGLKPQCSPVRGDTTHVVLEKCGTPDSVDRHVNHLGTVRTELDYGTRIVVLDDGRVLTVMQ